MISFQIVSLIFLGNIIWWLFVFALSLWPSFFSKTLSPLSILSPNLFCKVRKGGTCPRTFDLSHSLFSHWSLTCQYSFVSTCTPESTSNTPLVFLGFGQNYAFRKIWTTDIWIMDLQQFSTSYHPAVIKLGKSNSIIITFYIQLVSLIARITYN